MKAHIASLLSAIVLSAYVQAVPLGPDSTTISTISQSNLTANDAGFCAPYSEYHQWVKSGWLREDCYATFNTMRTSVLSIKDVEQTFVDIRSKSFPTKPGEVITPKKFTVGKFAPAFPFRPVYHFHDINGKATLDKHEALRAELLTTDRSQVPAQWH